MVKKFNKKGSLQDVLFIMTSLIIMAVVILIVFKISDSFNDELQSNAALDKITGGAKARTAYSDMNDHFAGALDNSFLILAVGLALVTFGLAVLVRIHPVFFMFFIIGMIILIFVCGILSNIYQEIAANPNFAAQAAELVFITNIITFLPFIVGIFGFILAIILYSNWKNAQ